MAMSLAELLNPQDWRRVREHQDRLQVEGYKYQQRDAHHRDEMSLGYERLNQDADQHRDKMGALARHDEIDRRRVEGNLEIDRQRLQFDRDNAVLSHQVALRTAEIQANNALDLARLNHSNAMQAINQQAHADIMRQAGLLPVMAAQSALTRGEDQNRAISGAIADAIRAKVNQKMAEKLEDQKERHRQAERRHEVEMAVLKAGLDRQGFTHQEITKIVARLLDPNSASINEDELLERFKKWYDRSKSNLS